MAEPLGLRQEPRAKGTYILLQPLRGPPIPSALVEARPIFGTEHLHISLEKFTTAWCRGLGSTWSFGLEGSALYSNSK